MKKHIITIAGRPGSGKSTTAKALAKQLGFQHFSSGDLFRQLGKDRGVDVLRGNMTPGITEELDHLVDSKLREIGKTEDNLVIDSRTAWHWIPASFKVFLNLDPQIGAKRILGEAKGHRSDTEEMHEDPAEYAKKLRHRLEVETTRYKAIYGIDPYDMANYDLVIDTEKDTIEKTVQKILTNYNKWLSV